MIPPCILGGEMEFLNQIQPYRLLVLPEMELLRKLLWNFL